MAFKRTLIAAFALLSVVAVWDMFRSGPGAFGSIFDQTVGQVEWRQAQEPARRPNLEVTRQLDAVTQVDWVRVNSSLGRLEITRHDSPEISAEYTVRVWGRGDVQAQAALVDANWVRDEKGVRLEVVRPETLLANIDHLRIDVRVAVPAGVDVFAAHRGDALIDGVNGALEFEHAAGSATLQRVHGPVRVGSRLADLVISDVEGPVAVQHSAGKLTVRNVRGEVQGDARFAEVQVREIAGDVTMNVSQGASAFEGVSGNLDVQGGFGETRISGVKGAVNLDYKMGAARVEGVTRDANLSLQFGDLEARLAGEGGWRIHAVADMGEITSDLPLEQRHNGPRTELSGVVGDGAYTLRIDVNQGSARIVRLK